MGVCSVEWESVHITVGGYSNQKSGWESVLLGGNLFILRREAILTKYGWESVPFGGSLKFFSLL